MATAIETYTQGHGPAFNAKPTFHEKKPSSTEKLHHVQTTLNYYKEPEDGSGPIPNYVGGLNQVQNQIDVVPVTVTDISGSEGAYTLDGNGFQIFKRASKEKDFVDEEIIKSEYYPEIEQLLKDA